jgi:ParB-like chromosome segregation protein Spo0J
VPIVVNRDGEDKKGRPIARVVDGRQRVRAAVEANKRLKKAGKPPLLVPAVFQQVDEHALYVQSIVTNEYRTADNPVVRAEKMQRMVAQGASVADIGRAFRRSAKSVREHLALTDCSHDVKEAVRAGKIKPPVARKLALLPKAEQAAALAEMQTLGAFSGKPAHALAEKALGPARQKPKSPAKKLRGYKEIAHIAHALGALPVRSVRLAGALEALGWVLGENAPRMLSAVPAGALPEGARLADDKLASLPKKVAKGAAGA